MFPLLRCGRSGMHPLSHCSPYTAGARMAPAACFGDARSRSGNRQAQATTPPPSSRYRSVPLTSLLGSSFCGRKYPETGPAAQGPPTSVAGSDGWREASAYMEPKLKLEGAYPKVHWVIKVDPGCRRAQIYRSCLEIGLTGAHRAGCGRHVLTMTCRGLEGLLIVGRRASRSCTPRCRGLGMTPRGARWSC